ncbi:MAG: HD domain-containing protein [Treponema sp.]|nr:HD domain-containing protein [Treponema sp.]
MKIRMDELIQSIGTALNIVESRLLGASNNHGKRIAVLCSLMAKELNMNQEGIKALTTCALFHDNALTEYIQSEHKKNDAQGVNFKLHCEYGQRNIEKLPFKTDINDFILYHHERADGSGLFGKREGEIPVGAELIAIADMIDVSHHLQRFPVEKLPLLKKEIENQKGKCYTKTAADSMLSILNKDTILSLNDESINKTASQLLPAWEVEANDETIFRLADLTAKIIDYASVFTRKHSVQIANKAWLMSSYYNFDSTMRAKIYLAAAIHDLGKLYTPTEILEKPGKLDENEFNIIKDHVRGTYDLLSVITGFEDICRWASSHHEKLDGTGYCFGKKSEELDFISRLLVCTDIYQAVCEERPYHPARNHNDTMQVLNDMSQKGFIDSNIVKDYDIVMADYSLKDVPSPVNIY